MNKQLFAAALAVAALPLLAGNMSAQDVSSLTATWRDPVPGAPAVTIGTSGTTATARWGVPDTPAGQSGYNMTPNASLTQLTTGTFTLGTFVHLNNPVFEPTLSSIFLDFTIVLGGPASPNTFMQSFRFDHLETPNNASGGPGGGICENGTPNNSGVNINGCADRVTFQAVSTPGNSFTLNGTTYFLELLGFQTGGTIVSEFWTVERADNEAQLIGRLSLRDPSIPSVPEPSSIALMVLGVAGLAAASRRRLIS